MALSGNVLKYTNEATFLYSGYGIAAKALTAVMRAHDGRDSQTMLTDRILQSLGLPSPDELIGYVWVLSIM